MFVRFRETNSSLQISIVETRRENGRVRRDHVASLGSIAAPASIADRVKFWTGLHERLERLSNRLGPDAAKITAAIHERLPMPTPDEQRELQLENARADERFHAGLADMSSTTVSDHKALAASIERKIAADQAAATAHAERAAEARDRAERIEPGDEVIGGLGKPLDYNDKVKIIKQAGLTDADIRHIECVGYLSRALGVGRPGNAPIAP
jgi:hypothetical protein